MRLMEFLDEAGVGYEITEHAASFSAQQLAAEEHEPGKYVAKPVVVRADGEVFMCVLSACCKINVSALGEQLGAKTVELIGEKEMSEMFGDCELGAEPPFGNLYDVPTIIDAGLREDDHILFQAGTHERAIRMDMADYMKLVKPKVLDFAYH